MRIFLYFIIAFMIINGWWFIALPFLLFGVWRYSFKYELIIAGVMYDALFGMTDGMGIWGYIGTIVSLCVVVALSIFKKLVR